MAAGSGRDVGEEDRASLPVPEEAREQPGRLCLPADEFGLAAFADDRGAAVGKVEVLDVEDQDLVGSGGGLVEEPPEGFLPQRMIGVEERSQFDFWDGSAPVAGGLVGPEAASFQAGGG